MNIIQNFPKNFEPRESQSTLLEQISQALEENNKFIIIQAPTGCGKSHIIATLANSTKKLSNNIKELISSRSFFDKERETGCYIHEDDVKENRSGSYVLTTTKYLQNQYQALFDNVETLKGKQNYKCNIDETFRVNVAPCVTTSKIAEGCIAKDFCSYYNQLNASLASRFRNCNYNKYLRLPSIAKHCNYMICDEASELENIIVENYSVTLNFKQLISLDITFNDKPTIGSCKKWLSQIKQSATKSYESISQNIKTQIHSKSYVQGEVGRLTSLRNLIENITVVLDNWHFCEYVTTITPDRVNVTPLYIDSFAKNIFSYSDVTFLISSTIYDITTFTKTLGIEKYKYIEHPGVFDSKKSPIYAPSKIPLNQKNLLQNLDKITNQVLDICEMYPDAKGIVHTHTNYITKELENRIKNKNRFLFKTDHLTNEHILYEHKNDSSNTILVSPSLAFGVDLPDDLCRFQIIIKLPYPSLGDQRIKTIAANNSDWYQAKMFTKLIQMAGRGTRNEFDYCDTFILDGNFLRVAADNWSKLPLFFRDRLK